MITKSYKPLQYYKVVKEETKKRPAERSVSVYYRKADGKLGHVVANGDNTHKEAILAVKEMIVANGDDIQNKAVLVAFKGGKDA